MADGEAFRLVPDAARPTTADWERAAARVLRRAGRLGDEAADSDVWVELSSESLEGGDEILPLGLPEHVPSAPAGRGLWPERGWDVRTWHVGPTAGPTAERIAADLAGGATSVWLTLAPGGLTAADLPELLADLPDDVGVVLDAPDDPLAAARALLAHRSGPTVQLGVDPLGDAVRRGFAAPDLGPLAGAGRLARAHGGRGLVVDAAAIHEQGGTEGLELGYALTAGTAYLRHLVAGGLEEATAFATIEFRFAATADVLVTAAKLRAARRLWARVAEVCGADDATMAQHAVSSRPMTTRRDPHTNLVRGTLAAVGAAVGGADAVTVLPWDAALGVPSAHGARLARTTQEVLMAEADLARVADPAGGAYAVERMTADLARSGWEVLGWIEREGGVEHALESGFLGGIVSDSRGAVRTHVELGLTPLVGDTVFARDDEPGLERPAYPVGLGVAEPWSAW